MSDADDYVTQTFPARSHGVIWSTMPRGAEFSNQVPVHPEVTATVDYFCRLNLPLLHPFSHTSLTMAPAEYDRLPEDAPLPPRSPDEEAAYTDTPSGTRESTYPPFRESLDSDGSGSDLVYRDIAEEDPFDAEKQSFSHKRSNSYVADDDDDVGYTMEPSRVSDASPPRY